MAAPVKKIKIGSVEVAIWKNESEKYGVSYSYGPPTKSYKNQKDEWQTTNNLKSGEALNAILCYQKAYEWVYTEAREEAKKEEQTDKPKF
jgi:hypothetical protein